MRKSYSIPLVFFISLLFALLIAPFLPKTVCSFIYSCGLLIKNLLIFTLPFIIFCLIFVSISALGSKALKYIAVIIPLICCSNFMNTMMSYFVSYISIKSGFLNITTANTVSNGLKPLFEINIPTVLSNNVALCSGFISGIILGIFKPDYTKQICAYLDKVTKIFFKILTPVMPIFVIGTAIKLQYDGVLVSICKNYLPVLLIFVLSASLVVLLQMYLLSGFNFKKCSYYLKNLSPAIVTAFGSMSSAAALPASIKAAEQNVKYNTSNAHIIVPSSVNIHLLGDCFFIPMIALSVMVSFGMQLPTFALYLGFVLHFVLAKFSVAAVPGGGVLVMFNVMQDYLHMSPEMLAIVTALYLLFDPIITTFNVIGNGAMAITFDRIVKC